jgi:hypothetical protein
MPIPQISKKNGESNINEADIQAYGVVNEGKDTKEEIVRKLIEKDKITEQGEVLQQEAEIFQEALHKTNFPKRGGSHILAQPVAVEKSEFLIQVENILTEDIGDLYVRMETHLREQFKLKGEEVARKIEGVVLSGKVRIKAIISWIKEWLQMIPGVNRFFLEQEAKIKGDKILAMIEPY